MFYAPEIIFGGTEGVGSRFHVLRSQNHFRRSRVRRVTLSCFTFPDSLSAVARASCPAFMFCAPALVFGGSEGVGSRFHVLGSRTHFRWCRVCRVLLSCFARPDSFSSVPRTSGPFLCFALPNSFSAIPRVLGPVFMFCAPGLIFASSEGVGSRFHVLRSRTRFRRYRGCLVPFSCF
jgi:hypothetical protein